MIKPAIKISPRRRTHAPPSSETRWATFVDIELHETEVDALIRSGFLEKSSRNDANAVTQALYRIFDRVA
jgi:hypothetical protein